MAGAGRRASRSTCCTQVEVDPPEPGPGQVRIRVTAAGIGLPDVFMCRGTYPLTPPLPFTPGQEATGTITAVGEGVDLAVGDRIMCVTMFWQGHGSFAEECLVAADSAFPIPDGLTDAEAAGFWIPHLTGVDRARRSRPDRARRARLAVLGAAGGSGIAAVQLGHALGATGHRRRQRRRARGVLPRARRRRRRSTTATDRSQPRCATRPTGAASTSIYDPVGGALAEDAATALARHGRLLAVGFASGAWPKIAAHDLVVTNTSLVGVFAGGYSPAELDAIHASLAGLVADGQLRNAVRDEVPFDELPAALQRMADRAVVGKLVMVP